MQNELQVLRVRSHKQEIMITPSKCFCYVECNMCQPCWVPQLSLEVYVLLQELTSCSLSFRPHHRRNNIDSLRNSLVVFCLPVDSSSSTTQMMISNDCLDVMTAISCHGYGGQRAACVLHQCSKSFPLQNSSTK